VSCQRPANLHTHRQRDRTTWAWSRRIATPMRSAQRLPGAARGDETRRPGDESRRRPIRGAL